MKDIPRRRQEDHATELRFRAARAVREHPWWSGSIVGGLIPVGATALVGLAGWAFGFVDTVSAAKEREAAIKKDADDKILTLATSVGHLADGLDSHNKSDLRSNAGASLGILDLKRSLAAAAANRCTIMRQDRKRVMTEFEIEMCSNYDADYYEAKRRFEAAQSTATQTWQQR